MAIVDIYGNPLRQQVLREPQTAKLGALHKEYAEHPAKGLTPVKMASILKEAEEGSLKAQAELFDDMEERDAHLFAEISKRKEAVIGLNWAIEAPKDATPQEQADADFLSDVLSDQDGLEDLFLDLLNGIGYGYSCVEVEWEFVGKYWLPKQFHARPQSWFQLAPDNQNELRLRKNGEQQGEPLVPFGWITHTPKAKNGYIARRGLYRVLAWPYIFKNYAIRDLAEMLEIYGLPLRIGKYPSGTPEAEKATLLRAVIGLGHSAAGIIPESMQIDFQKAAEGSSEPFLAMCNWADAAISKAVLGGTLTAQTSESGGSYSLGEVHNEVRHDIKKSDAKQLANTLTRDLLWNILVINRQSNNNARHCPKFVFDTKQPEDISKIAEAVPKLVEVGLEIPASWVHDKTGIPEALNGEKTLKLPTAQPMSMANLTALLPRNTAALTIQGRVADGQLGLDKANDGLDPKQINNQMAALLKPVMENLQALGANASTEDFYDALTASYPEMDESALRELLARAIFASEVWGRISG